VREKSAGALKWLLSPPETAKWKSTGPELLCACTVGLKGALFQSAPVQSTVVSAGVSSVASPDVMVKSSCTSSA